jgi:hypothetical protein
VINKQEMTLMNSDRISNEEAFIQNALTGLISQALFTIDRETPSDADTNYKTLYYGLFNGISLIIENANSQEQTIAALKHLQCKAEDAYIGQDGGYADG